MDSGSEDPDRKPAEMRPQTAIAIADCRDLRCAQLSVEGHGSKAFRFFGTLQFSRRGLALAVGLEF